MFRGKFANQPIRSAITEAQNLAREDTPRTGEFNKANTLVNPLGAEPARGWLCILRTDLDKIDVNGLQDVVLQYQDQENRPPKTTSPTGTDTLTLYNLVVTRDPVHLDSGVGGKDQSVCLVEVADARWRCKNPTYSIPINASYNVRQPTFSNSTLPSYCPNSTNGGAPWTWQEMVTDIWNLMQNQLGSQSQLPFTPHEPPDGWVFAGVSAWDALTAVLSRLGCAVKWNPFVANNAHSIVRVGAADTATDGIIRAAEAQHRLIHDGDFIPIVKGKIPYGVRVFFRRRDESTPASACDWMTGRAYSVDVVGPETAKAEPGVYTPIWDDLPAVYLNGILMNLGDLTTRAQERSDDYFRMLRNGGGDRLWKIYSGLVALTPGSKLKAVRWRFASTIDQDISTEIVNHPFLFYKINDTGQIVESHDPIMPPDMPWCPDTGTVVSFLTPPAPTFTVTPQGDDCCIWTFTLSQPQQQVSIDKCGLATVTSAGIATQHGVLNICACTEGPPPCDVVCDCEFLPCGGPCIWLVQPAPWGTVTCDGTEVDFSKFDASEVLLFWTEDNCLWQSEAFFSGMSLDHEDVWQIQVTVGGKSVFYTFLSSELGFEFDGCGDNVFEFNADLSECGSAGCPSQLIISPVGKCGPCPETCECVPGECGFCDNPPIRWKVVITGFTGPCEIFNGIWVLVQVETECLWEIAVGDTTITMEVTEGEYRVECDNETLGLSAVFTKPFVSGDCCSPVTLEKYLCACVSVGGGGGGCIECNGTPVTFTVEISGCTDSFESFNGTWEFEYIGGCVWSGIGLDLRLGIGAAGAVSLQMENEFGEGLLFEGTVADGNCCTDIELTFTMIVNFGVGSHPDTLTLQPSCVGGGDDGACPATIVAYPECCPEDEEPTGDCGDCSICPPPPGGPGSPDTWWMRPVDGDWTNSCCFNKTGIQFILMVRDDSADCLWGTDDGARTVTLFPLFGGASWRIVCRTKDGKSILVYDLIGIFNCCGPNRFRLNVRARTIPAGCTAPTTVEIMPPPDEGCPCEEDIPTTGDNCCACDASPITWELTVAGVTNGTCTDCATAYNGTFRLVYDPDTGPCLWCCDNGDVIGPCAGPPSPCNVWTLQCSGGVWIATPQLLPAPLTNAYFYTQRTPWNCLGENILDLVTPGSPDTNCNWPATVTVRPIV